MKCTIQTPTNAIDNSIEFYSKLGFKMLEHDKNAVFSEGKFILEVNPERTARAGLRIYGDDWHDTVKELQPLTTVIQTQTGFVLTDPSGSKIYLEKEIKPDRADLSAIKPSVLGNFSGLTFETTDMHKTLQLYQILQFKITSGAPDQGWISLIGPGDFPLAILSHGNCPHLFSNPSLSFFNGKNNESIIQNIRNLEIPITEEITAFNDQGTVDNIIIRDPGGLGFFIFND